MSYQNRINAEINAELDRRAADNLGWQAEFIAHAICANHGDGLAHGNHKDFWTWCGYATVRDATRRAINKRAGDQPDAEKDEQFILPGYEHVHRYYVVNRNGNDIGIPVHQMTDEEIEQKASLYRSMGSACFSHARELQRFQRERNVDVAA